MRRMDGHPAPKGGGGDIEDKGPERGMRKEKTKSSSLRLQPYFKIQQAQTLFQLKDE
jgi:hypothetical protein